MKWVSPIAFLLFLPLFAILVWNYLSRKKRKPSVQFSSIGVFKKVTSGWRSRLAFVPSFLKVIALGMAIIALARPQQSDTKVKRNVEGIDIMMVLDISDSMLIEDLKPNRIEASKKVIQDFIKGRQSDRIGFIIFSGESYTRVPLTLDYRLLTENVAAVQITRNIKMGTAIGSALANAVARLKDSTARSRVIVFLTDGENNSGTIDPETALEIAKGYGIKIYTIGAGIDGDAMLPIVETDAFGRQTKRYQPMHSTVNDDLLGRMASDTGGKYFRATDTQSLQKVFSDISKLEKTKIDVQQYTRYTELFPDYLIWAVSFYLLALFLSRVIMRRAP